MSETSSGTVQCRNCRNFILSKDYPICPKCGVNQYEVRHCSQCYSEMPLSAMVCLYCKHNQSFHATMKPCMLCYSLIPVVAMHCPYCRVTQDIETLSNSFFKVCNIPACHKFMSTSAQICYSCQQPQHNNMNTIHGSEVVFLVPPSIYTHGSPDSSHKSQGFAQPKMLATQTNLSGSGSRTIDEAFHFEGALSSSKICIFCGVAIPIDSQFCSTCQVTQNIDELKKSDFKKCLNPKCNKIYSKHLFFCHSCKMPQDGNTSFIRGSDIFSDNSLLGSQKNWPIEVSNASGKPSVGHPQGTVSNKDAVTCTHGGFTATRCTEGETSNNKLLKPCVLCNEMISTTSVICNTCKTPQDIDILRKSQFKMCFDASCKRLMREELEVCYRCKKPQNSSTHRIPGSTLSFPISEMGRETGNATDVVQSVEQSLIDISGHASTVASDQEKDSYTKTCVLCGAMIPISAQDCPQCRTTQDLEVFLRSSFKRCSNMVCNRVLNASQSLCYWCQKPQSDNASFILGSELTFPVSSFVNKAVSTQRIKPPEDVHPTNNGKQKFKNSFHYQKGNISNEVPTSTKSGETQMKEEEDLKLENTKSDARDNSTSQSNQTSPNLIDNESFSANADNIMSSRDKEAMGKVIEAAQNDVSRGVKQYGNDKQGESSAKEQMAPIVSTSLHKTVPPSEKGLMGEFIVIESEEACTQKSAMTVVNQGKVQNTGVNEFHANQSDKKETDSAKELEDGKDGKSSSKVHQENKCTSDKKSSESANSKTNKSEQGGSTSQNEEKTSKGQGSNGSKEGSKKTALLPKKNGPKPVGFKCATDQSVMRVIFKAILPTHCWGSNEKLDVYLRFGDVALGKWEYDYGPGLVEKNFGDGFLLIRFLVWFETSFLSSKRIPYKYLVYSGKVSHLSDAYEFLHEFSGNANRLLEIPVNKCKPKVDYRQYDTMILPQSAKTAIKDQFFNWFMEKVTSKKQEEVIIPQPHEMRKICMEYYLRPSKSIFLDGAFYDSYDISRATDGLVHLYQCLCTQKGLIPGRRYSELRELESLREVIKNWLFSVAEELLAQKNLTESKRLVSAISLFVAYKKFHSQYSISQHNQEKIFLCTLKMVVISPSGEEYKYLQKMLKSEQSKHVVLGFLVELFSYFIDTMKKQRKAEPNLILHLLKMYSVVHFLRGDCKPFQSVSFEVSKVALSDPHQAIKAFQKIMNLQSGLILAVIDEIKEFFTLDPLLIPVVVYLCPKDDLPFLCDYVPLHLILTKINLELDSIYSLHRLEVERYFIQFAMIRRISEGNFEQSTHCLKCFESMFSHALRLLNNSEKNRIRGVTSCALSLLAFGQNTTDVHKKDLCLRNVEIFIQNWLSKDSVIGGYMFGGSLNRYKKLQKKDAEMKVWEGFLENTKSKDYEELPINIRREWMDILHSILDSRVASITDSEIKVDLFCQVEMQNGSSEFLTKVFMVHAAKALDDTFLSKPSSSWISFLETAQSAKSTKITRIFGNLLSKKYPNFKGSLKLTELLGWDLWPGFIKIFATHSKVVQDTSQDWQMICVCAVTLLEVTCQHIFDGQISASELYLIKSKEEQMIKLVTSNASSSTGNSQNQTANALKQSIHERMEEYEFFNDFKPKLECLAEIMQNWAIAVQGLNQLLELLKRNNSGDPIHSLCTKEDGIYQIRCYPNAEVLFPYVEWFIAFFRTYPTNFFRTVWQRNLTEAASTKGQMSFKDVVDILKIVLDKCKSLLEGLKNLKMKLVKIDQELKGMYSSKKELYEELCKLNKAVSLYYREHTDLEWVEDISFRISQYWELCVCHEPAKALLEVRDGLGLTGDFSIVERVAKQEVGPDNTLKSIDRTVVVASRFLKEYAADKRRQECLKAFTECQGIVEWIRNLGKGENTDKESHSNAL